MGFKLNFIVQGFIPLKEDRVEKIKEQYGSVENLLGIFKDQNSEEIPLETDKLYVNVSKDVAPVIVENQKFTPKTEKEKQVKYNGNKKKIDYVLRNKDNSITGSKGEEIVLKVEKEYLEKNGRNDLSLKVKRVSIDDDTLGYDILSFDLDGKEKYIEVKTSTSKSNSLRFFVSLNEYSVGKEKENYYIYYVENINSENPKITPISKPMDPSKFSIKPDGYIFEAERS